MVSPPLKVCAPVHVGTIDWLRAGAPALRIEVAAEPLTAVSPTEADGLASPVIPPAGAANEPSPRRNVVVLFGGVGTAPPTVDVIAGRSAPVAMLGMPV